MRNSLGDKARLLHIDDAIDEIKKAVENKSYKEFIADHVLRIAVVKWLEIIGEASNYITNETKNKVDLEWNRIIGFRNFVVHEYFGINYDIVWETVNTKIKELKHAIEKLLKDFE